MEDEECEHNYEEEREVLKFGFRSTWICSECGDEYDGTGYDY